MDASLPVCLIDFETRSFLSVKDVGAWRYAEDITTEILCMAYKIGEGETGLWIPGQPFPQEILDHIAAGGMFEAHNVQFERAVWIHILRPQFKIPVPKYWKDTLAVCAYRGIPLALNKAGPALDLPIKKDEMGSYLLKTLSMPKWGTKKEPDRIYREDEDLMEQLYEYCKTDVESEKCLGDTLGDLPLPEYRLWCLDQRINQRGVRLDMDAVYEAMDQVEKIESSLNSELRDITDNAVERATQRDRLLKWLRANGMPEIPDLKKETLENFLLKDKDGEYMYRGLKGVEPTAIRALEIRAQLAKASTKKLVKMSQTVSGDGRVRGLLQYHGASTGRWAGRLIQPQNFYRPTVTNAENAKGKKYLDMELLVDHIKTNKLKENYDNPMEAVSSSLRGMLIADEDKVFRICDFSAIEARVTFWVAGCDVGLDVFHKSDRKESEDIYCVTASDLVGYAVKKATETGERQLGKITVLGCFEADTQVLTNRGWVRIIDVTLDDKLWDGEAWVQHEGLLYQGRKQTIRLAGIGVTPDHMMMTQEGWVPASAVANEEKNCLKSALWWAGSRLPDLTLGCKKTVDQKISGAIKSWLRDLNKIKTKDTSDVYDLLNVGPNHRFFVRAGEGEPILCGSNCGYQMGWSKLQFQAEKDYKVILEDHEAQNMVSVYREKYKEVKWLWYGLNEAAISTVKSGKPHSYGKIIYEIVDDAAGKWLACILPNGRRLWYYEPVVAKAETPWGIKDGLCYAGRDNKLGGSWGQIRTYGGMLTENVVQAIARDLMAEAMIRVEHAGYPIVLTVHDEIISEVDKAFGSQEEFENLMSVPPPWALDCPIAVEGGSVTRYQKV